MPLNSTRLTALRAARVALAAGVAVGLAGCILPGRMTGASVLPVDPNSPVAKDVANASRHPGPYPHFTDIPNVPTDIRPSSEWGAAVLDMQHRQAKLDAQVAALPPPVTGTEAFATLNRSKAPSASEAPPSDSAQQTEAYAQSLRARATPPPLPK